MTYDANQQGRARGAIGLGRPLNELCEVIQEGEFDRVFRAFLLLRKGFGGSKKEKPACDDTEDGSSPELAGSNPKHGTPTATRPPVIMLLQVKIHHWNLYPTLIRKFRPSWTITSSARPLPAGSAYF